MKNQRDQQDNSPEDWSIFGVASNSLDIITIDTMFLPSVLELGYGKRGFTSSTTSAMTVCHWAKIIPCFSKDLTDTSLLLGLSVPDEEDVSHLGLSGPP
jgi:hypothetical protein